MDRSPAPLDAESLAPALASVGTGRGLPGAAYTSLRVFDWEMSHLFADSWTAIGRAPAAVGASEIRAGDESFVVTRDAAGRIGCFFNVCRHRGHRLLEPGSSVDGRAIRCPYHSWVYGLDGALRGAPGFRGAIGFDPGHHGLVRARAAEWHGWLFANASADAPPLQDHAGGLHSLVSPYRPEDLVVVERRVYEVAANWKIVTENYHECYHCPSIHPELCRVSPPDSGDNLKPDAMWVGGTMELAPGIQTMSLTGASAAARLAGVGSDLASKVRYLGMLPNLLISLHPDYVLTHVLEPLAPDRTRIVCEWLFAPAPAGHRFDVEGAVRFWDRTNEQDWSACESVQQGVSSRAYRPGPLAPREDAVRMFIGALARSYLTGSWQRPATAPQEAGPAHVSRTRREVEAAASQIGAKRADHRAV